MAAGTPEDVDAHIAAVPVLSLRQQRDALRDGKLVGFRCEACGHDHFSPMTRCPACGSGKIQTREFSAAGTVVSHTIQHVASEAFMNEVPFAFAVIQLDDGPRVSGWVPYISKPEELPIGQKVRYEPGYKPGMMFEKA